MRVAELIDKLQSLPPDLEVFTGVEWLINVTDVRIRETLQGQIVVLQQQETFNFADE